MWPVVRLVTSLVIMPLPVAPKESELPDTIIYETPSSTQLLLLPLVLLERIEPYYQELISAQLMF